MKQRFALTTAHLKWIAIITMLIDHLTAGLLLPYFQMMIRQDYLWYADGPGKVVYYWYYILRGVGRVAFPLFCFMIVEGFWHTRDRRKYLVRLTVFGFLSEIPFDLAFEHSLFCVDSQNVFFTLAIGLAAIMVLEGILTRLPKVIWRYSLLIVVIVFFAALAWAIRTDYGACGVLLIIVFYLFREKPVYRNLLVIVLLYATGYRYDWENYQFTFQLQSALLEMVGVVSLILIKFYQGEKGRNLPKYFFYLFYPVHLLLIAGVSWLWIGFSL